MNISTIQSPENTLGILFEDVQLSTLFPDSKTFTDCVPKRDYQAILSDYLLKKTTKDFDLEGFIVENFIIPKPKNSHFVSDTSRSVEQHIEHLWAYLTREPLPENGTLIDLPNQYVVPGGRFQEIYYWDSYFTMLGLIGKHTDLVECMIDNFAFLIDTFGYIPNGNRSYFLGRSQPPFFALMVTLLADEKGEEFLLKYLPQLAKEYIFWMKGSEGLSIENQAVNRVIRLHDGSVLNRYWDENDTPRPESYREDVELAHANPQPEIYRHIRAAAESGWDFSSRWFADEQNMASIQTTNIIPVDLNCLLLNLEKTLLKCYQLTDNQAETKQFEDLITQRETAIQTYCWNEKNGFYFDYDWKRQNQTSVYSLAGVFPLFFQNASVEQAKNVAAILEEKFLQSGGLLTTLNASGEQWDAPNGWSPLHWIAYQGLKNYAILPLAKEIKTRWMATIERVYKATGKLTEKYNVSDTQKGGGGGEYPNQDGFGWTNGVYLRIANDE